MKIMDSVIGEYEAEEIRLDFDGTGKVFIRTKKQDNDGKAVIYTDLPKLKENIRQFEKSFPELITILTDDPVSDATREDGSIDEDKLLADNGMMQAAFHAADNGSIALVITPVEKFIELALTGNKA